MGHLSTRRWPPTRDNQVKSTTPTPPHKTNGNNFLKKYNKIHISTFMELRVTERCAVFYSYNVVTILKVAWKICASKSLTPPLARTWRNGAGLLHIIICTHKSAAASERHANLSRQSSQGDSLVGACRKVSYVRHVGLIYTFRAERRKNKNQSHAKVRMSDVVK